MQAVTFDMIGEHELVRGTFTSGEGQPERPVI